MSSKYWDYIVIANSTYFYGKLIDVTEGQTLLVEWDCLHGNQNGWVLNGNGCCTDIRKLSDVGRTGRKIVSVTASGKIRVASYTTNPTFAIQNGTVYVKIL